MNGESNLIRVLIVAASPIVRAGLETVLQTGEGLIITKSAADISAALSAPSAGQIADVLLVNLEQQGEILALTDLLGSADREDANFPSLVVLLSPNLQNTEQVLELLQMGVRSILPHSARAPEIGAAITAAANNLTAVAPETLESIVSLALLQNHSPAVSKDLPDEEVENLTTREREVLELLVEGESNKTIAYQLNISEHTVKFHIASIFGKLGVNTRTEAVTIALRRGLILL